MTEQTITRRSIIWLGIAGFAIAMLLMLNSSPQRALALDCDPGLTCAEFVDQDDRRFEVCTTGIVEFWTVEEPSENLRYFVPVREQ